MSELATRAAPVSAKHRRSDDCHFTGPHQRAGAVPFAITYDAAGHLVVTVPDAAGGEGIVAY